MPTEVANTTMKARPLWTIGILLLTAASRRLSCSWPPAT